MLKIKMARRAVVVFAVATTLAGVVPAQAAVTSHISTAFSGSFHGKITSASAHCVAGRTVKLFRQPQGTNWSVRPRATVTAVGRSASCRRGARTSLRRRRRPNMAPPAVGRSRTPFTS